MNNQNIEIKYSKYSKKSNLQGSRGLQDLNAGSDNEQSASGEDYDSEDPATGSDDVSNE